MGRRKVVAVALLLAVGLLAAGQAMAQQPKRGGELRIADREAPDIDPHLAISFLTHSWASMVYSQLVRFPHGPEQEACRGLHDPPRPRREVGVQDPDLTRLHTAQGR